MVIDDWEGNLSELKKVHPNWFWTAYPDGETWVYSGKSARYSCQVLVFPLIKILRDPLEDREVYKWFVQMKGTGVILPYDDFRRGKGPKEKR